MAPTRLQVAVLLLAGLAVASAALPKHPFFGSGSVQAGAKDYHYDDYDSTKLYLQNTHTCFADGDIFSYTITLGCLQKDNRYRQEDSMLDLTSLGAGWCLFHFTPIDVGVASTSTDIAGMFEAQCFLHNSGDCDLGECENAVMRVEGIVTWQDDVVFDSNYIPSVSFGCNNDDGRRSANNTKTLKDWVEGMRQALRIPPPSQKASAKRGPGPTTLYVADALFYHGVATTYSSSGKLIGTGAFEYVIPFVFDQDDFVELGSGEVGTRRVYTPQSIRTGVHSLPKGHY